MASPASQSFGTVLVARKSSDAPSDFGLSTLPHGKRTHLASGPEIERILRHWTQTLRVVASLSGGAHFVFRGTGGGASAAVRVYDAKSILRIESEGGSSQKKTSPMHSIENTIRYLAMLNGTEPAETAKPCTRGGSGSDMLASNVEPGQGHSPEDEAIIDDIDGLRTFRDSFKDPVVLFVLPPGQLQQEQLGRSQSFFMRAQRALGGRNTTKAPQQGGENPPQTMARVFIVPDVDSALRTISNVLESIRPEKLALKRQFFENAAMTIPDAATGHPPSEDAVARQAAGAFRAWAQDAGIPDSDVLFTALGTLDKISAADATVLDIMPLEEATKTAVMSFFGSGTYISQHEVNHEENPTHLVDYDCSVQDESGHAFSAPMPPHFAAAAATTAQTQGMHLNFTPMQPSFDQVQVQAQALHQQHGLNDQQHEPPLLQQQSGAYRAYTHQQLQGQPNAHQQAQLFHPQQESFHQYRYPGAHHQDTPQYLARHIGSHPAGQTRTVRQPSATNVIPNDRARSTSWSGMERGGGLRYSYSTQRFGNYR